MHLADESPIKTLLALKRDRKDLRLLTRRLNDVRKELAQITSIVEDCTRPTLTRERNSPVLSLARKALENVWAWLDHRPGLVTPKS